MAKKILFFVLLIAPFMLGTIGYCIEGLALSDALYAAFALHAINPVIDEKNILIEFARWLCPLALACGVIIAVRELGSSFKNLFLSLSSDCVTIYSDNVFGEMLKNNIPHSILAADDTVYGNKNIIIMYSDQKTSLEFLANNKNKLQGKNIYVRSEHFDPLYIGSGNIRFFDLNGIIAREYWKIRDLTEYFSAQKTHIKIALIGFNELGEHILSGAVMNNVYSLDQCIEYHVWGESSVYRHLHSDLEMMNDDRIIYHEQALENEMHTLKEMDRIIVTDSDRYDLLAAIFELCTQNEIHCFSADGSLKNSVYNSNDKIKVFGNYSEILTYDNIITDKLYETAMELHYAYVLESRDKTADVFDAAEMEEEWEKLDGFTKMSNIASADYHDIRLHIMAANGMKEANDTLSELEHIRWCRFLFLNHWKYGETASGKKDSDNRIHPCLTAFSNLPPEIRKLDEDSVKTLLKLKK